MSYFTETGELVFGDSDSYITEDGDVVFVLSDYSEGFTAGGRYAFGWTAPVSGGGTVPCGLVYVSYKHTKYPKFGR